MKVRENSRVIDKTIHIAIGLRIDGRKEVLGLWLGKNESAYFWLSILTDLKARGVQDILITATDNLKGYTKCIPRIHQTDLHLPPDPQCLSVCGLERPEGLHGRHAGILHRS